MNDSFIQIKVLFVGDQETGSKTSFIKSFTDGSFSEHYIPSIGVDFRSKDEYVFDMDVSLQLWDTSGNKNFITSLPTYYKMAHCFVIGYSITDRKSFESISEWITSVKEKGPERSPILIVGAKDDLEESRCVTYDEGKEIASKNDCLFYEISSKTGHNVNESIIELTKRVLYERYPHLVKKDNDEEGAASTFGNKTIDLPKLPVVANTTTSTISIQWVPEDDEAHFKIMLWRKDSPHKPPLVDTLTVATNFTFEHLDFDTDYIIAVTGLRKVVLLGLETRSSGFMTIRTAEPEPPGGIWAAENGCDYVVLECEPSRYPSVAYQVRYMKEGDGGFAVRRSSLETTVRVDGLDDGSLYLFQMRVLSRLGRREGKWSESIRVRTMNK